MREKDYDKLLNIRTEGVQLGFNKSFHYHRYEPTPYSALEVLFRDYDLKSSDRIVDFGCGKGRLLFYINYLWNAYVTGVEMNEELYTEAIRNRDSFLMENKKGKDKVHFYYGLAQDYQIDSFDNRFYFFNPFSIQVFMNIVNNILRSMERAERQVDLVLYYPSEEYIYFLENQTAFALKQEVKLRGNYGHNANDRFLIYRLVL
ncbi:methyltransferase domain-containing protein [Bacillus sp. V5-8f]|uniref:methyltransferase domain-containing protein n=1 Tax=Bacillus sp. V5-8f TaxID=2053044 RepID=UPI000C77B324|nr:methyltransferase domain-containing protein [Bacillus sp. V5-8f]PLT33380.1 SAM-dependent methyltransferase [Bacillus sp. V5-8f]